MTDERIAASRLIPADPADILAVLRDPDGHVAIDSSGMLQSAEGGIVEQEGDAFLVHMDREALGDYDLGRYDVTVRITAYRPDEQIEWRIETGRFDIGHRYGYLLRPAQDGTEVESYCDWSMIDDSWKPIFPVIDAKALKATLGILERAVLRGYPRPPAASPA
jgi:hypothetical protein